MAKAFCPRKNKTQYSQMLPSKGGCTFKSSKNRGLMELGGKGHKIYKICTTHNFAGVKSSFSRFASFSSPNKTPAHTVWHRKQNSNGLHQQIRGNPFTSSDISSHRDVEFCSRQKPDFVSSVCSWRRKSDCRQKVKGAPGQPGMDAASSSVSGITKKVGCFDIDLFANQHFGNQSLGQFPQMFSM